MGGTCSASRATEQGVVDMVRTLLIRGMLVGIVAGLLTFGFGKVFGEPQVDRAIAVETQLDEAKAAQDAAKGIHHEEEPELVSRPVQAGIGLFTAVVVYCTAFGGLFALVFAAANGRVGNCSPRAVAALLAGAGFVAVYLVPVLKYPANPPSVGQPDTIGHRTALYFAMMLVSVAGMVGAVMLRNALARRHGAWSAALTAGAGYLVVVFAAQLLLPAINEVPEVFPAVVLWNFRIASLGMQAVMWTTLGLLFGWLTERAAARDHGRLRNMGFAVTQS
jgi:Probable cobalt transporter subunit (CbtA)